MKGQGHLSLQSLKGLAEKKARKLSGFVIYLFIYYYYYYYYHNYNKIVKSDWLSTSLISALIGQLNRAVRVMPK